MAPRKRRATNDNIVTIPYKRRNTRRKLIDEAEESARFEKSTEEVENTGSKHSTDEGAHGIDASSTNVEEEDRGVEDEQNGTTNLEKETSPFAESFPIDPSLDSSFVKTIRYADYNLESMIDRYPDLKGSFTIKSELGKFSDFKKILKEQKLRKFFRSSIFENYLQLPDNTIAFQMSVVYQLLRRQIYSNRKEEIWINYSGMPICFGMKEFAIMTGLNCHMKEVYDEKKMSPEIKSRRQEIIKLIGKSCKRDELVKHLNDKDVDRDVKKSLCLLYFVSSMLCVKDVNTLVDKEWILLSADREAFSAYPWGRISYDIIIQHLLQSVKPSANTTNLYGFPWAFMCWAFEVIPFLRKKFKVYPEQVSSPRIFRWLLATNDKSIKINELFYPIKDSIVHPWLIPTPSEMEMEFFTKFVPKELTKDDKIEKLEMDLNGVVAIKRDIIAVEHNVDFERGERFDDVSDNFRIERPPTDENIFRAQEIPSTNEKLVHEKIEILTAKVESLEKTIVTNDKLSQEKIESLTVKVESLETTIVTMMSKRGIRPSSKVSYPYTPDYVRSRKRQLSNALSNLQKKTKKKACEDEVS